MVIRIMNERSMICRRHTFVALITATILLTGAIVCQAATVGRQLQSALSRAALSTELPVIITFSDKVDVVTLLSNSPRQRRGELVRAMQRKATDSQQPLKDFLQQSGIKNINSLWIINGLVIDARPDLIKTISQWPGVEEIRTNGMITVPEVTPQAVGTPEWNISAIGAEQLWNMGMTGAGVVVATMDTGVDGFHPDLQSKWRGWSGVPCDPLVNNGTGDWFDPYGEHPNCPYDGDGHGTGVMGIIAGGDFGGTSIGVAPDARWIAARIFNDAGNASFADIHSAFQWVLDPDGDLNTDDAPDIVNNSWGLDSTAINQCIGEFQPDIQLLKAAAIAVVFSGGNDGPNPSTSVSPANYPESFSVGATDYTLQDAAIADFSARGPNACPSPEPVFPNVTAPGVTVRTADLSFGGVIPSPYTFVSGTSFSAPHVSGLMALLLGAGGFPASTVAELEDALKFSATDLGAEGPDNDFGYGQINSVAAAKRLDGQPHLAVYDPKPPEHDRFLDFGLIPGGTDVSYSVVIRNGGGGILTLAVNDWATLPLSFSVLSDTCSGVSLVSDGDCRLLVQFSPVADGLVTGSLSFSSNDTGQDPVVVSLAGTGELTPLPPQIEVSAVDQILDFGAVPPGSTLDKILTTSNSGEEFLIISAIDSAGLPPQFSIVADSCSGSSLTNKESCTVHFSFAPDSSQIFQGSIGISSNDPDQSQTTIFLMGTGQMPPQIEVSAVDQALDFGSVPPGSTLDKVLTISNSGEEILTISSIDSAGLPSQFSIGTENCIGSSLANNDFCTVLLSFTPESLQTFQGSIEISSNDPDQNLLTISLSGIGNNPPNPALLISPLNGTTGLETTVTFQWQQSTDPDGDLVTDTLVISELAAAPPGITVLGATILPGSGWSALGYIQLLIVILLMILFWQKPKVRFAAILTVGLILTNSCGGGSDAPVIIIDDNSSLVVTTLKSGTSYSWMIVSDDGRGGSTDSISWNFSTR